MSNNIKILKKHGRNFLKDESLKAALRFSRTFQQDEVDQSVILVESYDGTCISDSEYRWIESALKFFRGNIYVSVDKKEVTNYTNYLREKGQNGAQVIARHSFEYVRILSKANFLVTNYALPSYFIKKENQKIIFNFSYSPIKSFGYDEFEVPQITGVIQRVLLMSDFLVYPNEYTKECLRSAFQLDSIFTGEYIEHDYGNYIKEDGNTIRETLDINDKEVFCFLPSWKEAFHESNLSEYSQNLSSLFDVLDNTLLDNQVMYVKMHPLFKGELIFTNFKHILPFPTQYQTLEFIMCANCVISDYTSSIFSAMKNDIDVILHVGGGEIGNTYIDLSELPVAISTSDDELVELLNNRPSREGCYEYASKFFNDDGKDNLEVIQAMMNQKTVKTSDGKENIVIYVGDLKDDNLVETLINKIKYSSKSRYTYTILFYQKLLEDRISKLEPINDDVVFLPIVGKKAMTIKESIAHHLFYRYNHQKKWILECVESIYEREYLRIFGSLEFGELIHYSGVEKHIIQLFKHASGTKTIYMHPALMQTKKQMKKTHIATLYEAYRNFDKVIYASSSDNKGFDRENEYTIKFRDSVPYTNAHDILDNPLQTIFLTRASLDSWNEIKRLCQEAPDAKFIVCYDGELPEHDIPNLFLVGDYDNRMLERCNARLIIERGPSMTRDCIEAIRMGVPVRAYDLSKKLSFLKFGFGKVCETRSELCSMVQDHPVAYDDKCLPKKIVLQTKASIKTFVRRSIRKARKLSMRVLKKTAPIYSKIIRKNKKTILFISFHGRGYSDNPKALHEYMLDNPQFKDFKFVWAIKGYKKKKLDIPNAKQIEYAGLKYLYYLARSKYWISNCKLPAYVYKSKNQVYLQTWHGTPLKRLAHDIIVPEDTTFYRSEMSFKEMAATYDNDVAKYNYMISPSAFTTEVFQSAFAINRERLIETGYPRNDCLSNYKEEELNQLKDKYGIPKDKKVILYAPTWRDNSYNLKGYTFKLEVDFTKWKEILGDEYVIIFKPHYLIISDFDVNAFEGFVYSIDATEDISRLYIVSDILITDYSSVFFDYSILERPVYFYMYDLESYRSELRGFYIDIYKDLPGDVFESETMMLKDIRDEKYDYDRLEEFNKRFNNCEDGNASKRVIDILMERK